VLPDHDVKQRDERERQCARHRDAAELGIGAQQWSKQTLERGLAHNAQTDAGDRDPELAGGKLSVEMGDGVPQRP
jgi:hypothetical protein